MKLEKLFDRLGIDVVGEDEVVTLWDLINEDNAGCISCVEADGETVFDIPENLKSEGMYEAEWKYRRNVHEHLARYFTKGDNKGKIHGGNRDTKRLKGKIRAWQDHGPSPHPSECWS